MTDCKLRKSSSFVATSFTVVRLDPQYNPQPLALADRTKAINGYMIQVKGYASSVGSANLNQKLSEDRANNVADIMQQQGHLPLTKVLSQSAMGESRRAGNDQTVVLWCKFSRIKALPGSKIIGNLDPSDWT
jgi:outer membrane protein OmpA-like peptidoglycan-associated protein